MQSQEHSRPSFLPFFFALFFLCGELFLTMWQPEPEWVSRIGWLHGALFWALWIFSCFFLFAPVWILRKHGGVRKNATYVETEKMVTTSLYCILRHPQYFGWVWMYWALVCFNPNWSCVCCALAGTGLMILVVHQEDRYLVKKFGQAYQRYQEEVPAFNLISGILRRYKQIPRKKL